MKNRTLFILCFVCLLLFFLVIKVTDDTNPSAESITGRRFLDLALEAREFRQKVGKNPHSLNDLVWFSPLKPTNRLLDGRGNPFIIEVAADGGITISTHGKDNKRGRTAFLPP